MKLKTLLTIGLCAGLGSGFAAGRTWTSSDGSKTFEGEFESYDADTSKVTVTKKAGRPMTFSLAIVSEEDQVWIKEQPSKQDLEAEADASAAFGESEVGKSLAKAKILEGKSFADFAYETPPKYFILYYTASW